MAKVSKANISIKTIDSTTRSPQINDTWNAVIVVDTPTGPYEKTYINNKGEFINRYLASNKITSDDHLTIQNAAFLLDSMPLTVIRAASTKVRSGITDAGDVIFTNSRYVPFNYSTEFTIPGNLGNQCYPSLCIKCGDERYSWLIKDYVDSNKYTTEVVNYATGDNKIQLTSEQGFDGSVQGIDLLYNSFSDLQNANKIDAFRLVTNTSNYFTAYMDSDVDIEFIPDWVTKVSRSNLSKDVSKVTFDTDVESTLVAGEDYISINGYYFYFTNTEGTNNFITSGTPVAIKLLRGDAQNVGTFSIYVKDLLRCSSKYSSPLITDETMSVNVTGVKMAGGIANYLDLVDSNITVKKSEILARGTDNGGYFLELNVGGDVSTGVTTGIPVSLGSITDFTAGFTPAKKFCPKGTTIKVTTSAGTVDTITDKDVVVGNGIGVLTYQGATITLDYVNKLISIINPQAGWTSIEALVTYPYFEGGHTKRFFLDYNKPSYDYPEGGDAVSIATTEGKITMEKFLLRVNSLLKEDTNFTDITTYSLTSSTMYSLNTVYRELTTGNANKILIARECPNFKKISISKDSINLNSQKYWWVIKLGNYTFYNNPNYEQDDYSEVLIRIGNSMKMSQDEFVTEFLSGLPSNTTYYSIDNGVDKFTLFSEGEVEYTASIKVDDEDEVVLDQISKSYDAELQARYAVINKFSSKAPLSTYSLANNEDGTYELTLGFKETSNTYTVSFIPGTVDGYGTSIYYDFINNYSNEYRLIDINMEAQPQESPTIQFGDEITPPSPLMTDYQNAINQLTKKDGSYYDYIITSGYDNAGYMKYAGTIGSQTYTQVFSSIPPTITDVDQSVSFRSGTGIDNWENNLFFPYFYTTTVGEFSALIAPASAALTKAYNNKLALKEFVPLFWKEYGVVPVSTSLGLMNGLTASIEETEEQEKLLSAQINPIVIDQNLNICYLLDHWTMQQIDSDLSDSCNVRMINVLSHVTDQVTDNFIAKDNNQLWRDQVISKLNDAFTERFAGQQRKYRSVLVVCDATNNPIEVIRRRQLVVDIYIQFEVATKYIKVYNRVIPLNEA